MKTIKLFFIALAVLSVGFFTSCEDDEVATGPTIEFISGTGIITASGEVTIDEPYSFKCLVTKGTADLLSFDIKEGIPSLTGYPKTKDNDDNFDEDSYTVATEALTQVSTGSVTYTFIAIDKDGLTDTKTITITVVASSGPIDTYTDKLLGANQNTTTGSSFASIDGTIYDMTDATANQNKIDFVYFYGASNHSTIAAPSDADASTMFTAISSWTVKNATHFVKTSITTTEFDAITTDAEIVPAAADLTATKVNLLEVGDVLAFETAATSANPSKKGLIKVTAITPENTGTITITVKVQQ